MSFAIIFCNASDNMSQNNENEFILLRQKFSNIDNFILQSFFHLYGEYDFCIVGKISGTTAKNVGDKIKNIISKGDDNNILYFQCENFIKLPKNKIQFLSLVKLGDIGDIDEFKKDINNIQSKKEFALSCLKYNGKTKDNKGILLVYFRTNFRKYYEINKLTNNIDTIINDANKTTLIVAKDYVIENNSNNLFKNIFFKKIVSTFKFIIVSLKLYNFDNNKYIFQKFNEYFNIESFKDENKKFYKLGYIHIKNGLTKEGIKFFKDISLSINYIRKDIIINSTFRKMDVSGGKKLLRKKELVEIYKNTYLINILKKLTAEKNIKLSEDNIEWAISTKLSKLGDTHGWHKDDYPISFIIVVEQPKKEFGGIVKLKSRDKIIDLELNTGDCYIIRSDKIPHKVTELNTNKQERIIFNLTYSIKGFKKY